MKRGMGLFLLSACLLLATEGNGMAQPIPCHSDKIPAPTVSDMSPGNRHTACPLGGVTLQGTPSEPRYSLVWAPACTTAVPQHYSGDSVAVSYQGEVCDIHVYNYDRVLQCLSKDYLVHKVERLKVAPLGIPRHITVCPNSLLVWGDEEVPDQSDDGMLYEWKIEDYKQYCASVQGSHLTPAVTLAVNNIATPETFYVELIRSYCGGSHSDYIYIHVVDSLSGGNVDSILFHPPYGDPHSDEWRSRTPIGYATLFELQRNRHAAADIARPCREENALHPDSFNPVTITSANAANNNYTCDNTPIQLTASLNTPGEIVSSNWTFGDGSSFETNGNSIYHTYKERTFPYTVSVTIIDTNKCTKTSKVSLAITSYPNDLNGGLNYQNPYICPNTSTPNNLEYAPDAPTNSYQWTDPYATSATSPSSSNIHPTYYQGDYKLYVENIYYCKKELSTYVKFLSAPTAVIYAEHFTCCVGDKLKLHGRMGPSSAPLDYLWTITDPTGGNTQTYTTPNVVFTAPNTPGTYTVTLTVTNTQTTCSATATETVTVTTPRGTTPKALIKQ